MKTPNINWPDTPEKVAKLESEIDLSKVKPIDSKRLIERIHSEHITCPCCQAPYSAIDAPEEYKRVASWSPGRALGKRNAGKPRHITDATRQARIAVLAKWRASKVDRSQAVSHSLECELSNQQAITYPQSVEKAAAQRPLVKQNKPE